MNSLYRPVASLAVAALGCVGARTVHAAEIGTAKAYDVVELTFSGPTKSPADLPTLNVDFTVNFQHESGSPTYRVHGYWDGDGTSGSAGSVFRVRFCPTKSGRWNLAAVSSNASELHGQRQGDHLTVADSTAPGFWLPDPSSPGNRWYMRSNGSHQYIVGNTHYDFLFAPNGQEASAATIEADIAANATYFKKLRFSLMSPRSENASSLLPFYSGNAPTSAETEQPNPLFFRSRVDKAVLRAHELDLITDLVLGGTIGDQVADKTGYLKYIAARYGSFPNVWITIGQEYNEQASASHQKEVGQRLRGYLPYGTPLSTHGTDAWSASLNGDWHDHTIRQGKFAELSMAADAIGADHAAGNAKPAINDENGYDPNESSTEDVLEGIAGSLAGGGYGSTGHKTGSKQGGYFWGHAAVGATIDVHPSRLGLRFMRESVDEHVRFWRMMPKAPNQSIFAKFSSGFRVLEWSGEQYLLASDAAAAGEAHLPSGTWRVLQFDVVNTERDTLSESASGTFAFTTPASRAALTLFVRIGGAAERPDEGGGSGGSGSGGSDSGDGSGDGGFGGAGTAGTSGGTNGPSGGAVDGSGGMSGASASNGAEAGDGATDDAGCACRAARVSDLHAGSLGLLGLIAALRRRRNRSLRG